LKELVSGEELGISPDLSISGRRVAGDWTALRVHRRRLGIIPKRLIPIFERRWVLTLRCKVVQSNAGYSADQYVDARSRTIPIIIGFFLFISLLLYELIVLGLHLQRGSTPQIVAMLMLIVGVYIVSRSTDLGVAMSDEEVLVEWWTSALQ
jgi:hypothetical protein